MLRKKDIGHKGGVGIGGLPGVGWESTEGGRSGDLIKASCRVCNNSSGLILATPGAGKAYLITDIMAQTDAYIRTLSGDSPTQKTILVLGAGNIALNAPILCPEDCGLETDAGHLTINYHIVDVS